MKRSLALILALAFSLAIPFANAKTTTLKIATLAPDGTGWMKAMREAAKEINEETEGRVRIRYFPGGVQGSDKSVLRKIQIRQLQGGAISSGALVNISNMTQLYSMPFTFKNLEEVRAIRGEFDPIIANALAENGFTLLGMSEGGFAYLMSATSLEDSSQFASKKVWAPEGDIITQGIFKNAGVEPIALPVSDVYTSLQTGLIDTIAANPTSVIAMQWHTKLNYAADLPLAIIMGLLVVDSRALDAISAEDKQIVVERMRETFKAMDLANEKDELAARQALEKNGVKFQKLSEQDQATWEKMAADSVESQKDKGIYPVKEYQQLLDRLKELRQ